MSSVMLGLSSLADGLFAVSWRELALQFLPFALLLELPLMLLVTLGMFHYAMIGKSKNHVVSNYFPKVSCIVTCYAEKEDVGYTLKSLSHQIYPGSIEIIAVIDGAIQNKETLLAARQYLKSINALPGRRLIVLPKWQRGGRVSSLNTGRAMARGQIVMALDGDTSFDNNMVYKATAHFQNPDVIAVSGNLRARNAATSLVARLQALQYLISISAAKTGLSAFNVVNNISGAFGIFRADILRRVGGWDAGSAEDLDMTQRLKQLFRHHPNYKIVFDPEVVGHTDVPTTLMGFFKQRLRWDGDAFYIYIRKYKFNLNPNLIGWRNFWFHILGGIFLQMAMPFFVLAYLVYLFVSYPLAAVLSIFIFVYIVYECVLAIYFLLYCGLISERWRSDLIYLFYLPLYPLFALLERANSIVGLLHEVFNRSHLDSAMAPWWVLRKTKY